VSLKLDKQVGSQGRYASQYGIASLKELRCGVNRYRWDLIERDVNAFLLRRRDLPTGSPGTYPETLVKYMASIYLSCSRIEGRPPPENLAHLISHLLEVPSFALKGADRDSEALERAREIRHADPGVSNKAIAREIGVAASTVGRWVKDELLAARD
jgi:hypothetical protein